MILVPYANAGAWELQAVRRNLDVQGLAYDAVDVSGSNTAYPDAVRARWDTGEDLVIIEHDILPWPGAIDELLACPFDLCGLPYVEHSTFATALGCTRIGQRVQSSTEIPLTTTTQGPPFEHPVTWNTLDWDLFSVVQSAGFRLDVHAPPVVHLHEGFRWDRSAPPWQPFDTARRPVDA
jgi:hypothetical protein